MNMKKLMAFDLAILHTFDITYDKIFYFHFLSHADYRKK